MTPNIDRNSTASAVGCGFAQGARSAPALACLDFVAEYQVLVQPDTSSTSRVTISATVMGVTSRGFPAGIITDPQVVGKLVENMRQRVTSGIQAAAPVAVAIDVPCPAGTHRAGQGCLSDSSLPSLPPGPSSDTPIAAENAPRPDWCTGEQQIWRGDHCEVRPPEKTR